MMVASCRLMVAGYQLPVDAPLKNRGSKRCEPGGGEEGRDEADWSIRFALEKQLQTNVGVHY
jgi:hypothetical protein